MHIASLQIPREAFPALPRSSDVYTLPETDEMGQAECPACTRPLHAETCAMVIVGADPAEWAKEVMTVTTLLVHLTCAGIRA